MQKKEIQIEKTIEPFIHSMSGATASAISTLILYPIENIKTRVSYIYELVKKGFTIEPGSFKGCVISSLLAGSATSVCTNPFWVINTRMTFQKDNSTFFQVMFQMIKNEGIESLFKGLSASLLLVINPIIQFTIYEFLKIRIQGSKQEFLLFFIAGALSKVIATVVTYPTQLLRTHSHMDKSQKRESYIRTAKRLIKEGGISSLYRGVNAKMLQSVLNSAFMLSFYEKIFSIIKKLILFYILKQTSAAVKIQK